MGIGGDFGISDLLQKRFQLFLGLYPNGHIHRLAVPEEEQRGDGRDLVLLSQFRNIIYIDLAKRDLGMALVTFSSKLS